MTNITDEYMQDMLPKAKSYVLVLLKPGPTPDSDIRVIASPVR